MPTQDTGAAACPFRGSRQFRSATSRGDHYDTSIGSSVTGFQWAAMGIAGGIGALFAGHLRTTGRERHIMAIGMVITALAAWPVAVLSH